MTLVLVSLTGPVPPSPQIERGVFYVTGAVTAVAGLQYMYRGLAWLQSRIAPTGGPANAGERSRTSERRHQA